MKGTRLPFRVCYLQALKTGPTTSVTGLEAQWAGRELCRQMGVSPLLKDPLGRLDWEHLPKMG